jgi:hypothetical protein
VSWGESRAIAIIFTGYRTWAFLSASSHLKVAKEDAFVSLHALREASALAYSANADESRYLLDSSRTPTHKPVLFTKILKSFHGKKTGSFVRQNFIRCKK